MLTTNGLTMPITMYDSVNLTVLPSGAQAYAGYVDGTWPTYNELKVKFPDASILSIATNASYDADSLDVETGDAVISDITDGLWYARQISRGVQRPCFYMSASKLSEAQDYLKNISRSSY